MNKLLPITRGIHFHAARIWFMALACISLSALAADLDPVLRGKWPTLTGGEAHGVALSGNYAFVADNDAGMQVIDISNPANPQHAGSYNAAGSALGVAVSGNYAYVMSYFYGLHVIDVSNPANPRRVGRYASAYSTSVT